MPPRPPLWEERASGGLLFALAPRVGGHEPSPPPARLEPFESVEIPRRNGRGTLAGWWFPARGDGSARAVAVLCHPWVPWGQEHFFRRGRIQALREAGFDVLTWAFSGFGRSGPRRLGYLDHDVDDALDFAKERADGRPLVLWGVSSGGYWAHCALGRRDDVAAAVFEDVAAHLIEWSRREAPFGKPFYLIFETLFRRGWRYLDMRRHAPHLRVAAAAYVSGADDRGARPDDTRLMAARAETAGIDVTVLIVDDAGHLDSIRRAGPRVIERALETFERGLATSSTAVD